VKSEMTKSPLHKLSPKNGLDVPSLLRVVMDDLLDQVYEGHQGPLPLQQGQARRGFGGGWSAGGHRKIGLRLLPEGSGKAPAHRRAGNLLGPFPGLQGRRRLVVRWEEIEHALVDAGWELDGSFSDHLLVGEDGELSILVPQWVGEMDDPVYELCDGERQTTYWVGEIPTPQQAAMLLEEHGGPPEEERGNPYKKRTAEDEEG